MAAIACSTRCGSPALAQSILLNATFFAREWPVPNLGDHALLNNS